MSEFLRGVGMLVAGFEYWRRMPARMAWGLAPALLVGAVLLAGLVALSTQPPWITDAITPFADGWPGIWAVTVRIAAGTALIGAALALVAVSFTALTLMVGEPFYDRIWRAVESDLGGELPGASLGFWGSVQGGLSLLVRGLLVALIAALLGLIPWIGGALAASVGLFLTAGLIAEELASRALGARGLTPTAQRRLIRRQRPLVWGFGVATQVCFLVPLGAVAAMPAAVAGSTRLARELLTGARLGGS